MSVAAALAVLATHLTNAGAALTDPIADVDRGLPTGGRMIRYYWGGEVDPPHMGGNRTLTGDLVGQRVVIVACWPLASLDPAMVTAFDIEIQALAADIRSRIDGDSTLGGNITDLELDHAVPDIGVIANARHLVIRWDLDLAYTEATLAP